MRHKVFHVVATSLLLIGLFGATEAVNADHIEIEAFFPESIATGDTMDLRVIVRTASGQRIADATVIASRQGSIAGVTGDVELARGVTDELGIATLRWTVRTAPSLEITIAYSKPGESDFESVDLPTVDVTAGGQLERSTSGIRIPGFGAWVLIALLVGIWGLIQLALSGPVRIAAASTDSTHHHVADDDATSGGPTPEETGATP